jgi:iron complex transport system substrate-binding protein
MAAAAANPAASPTPAAAPMGFMDDDGQRVPLAAPARRIVSLSPGATAMLFAAGAGDRVVGTARFSDEPAAARRIPRIGDSAGYDLERIVALRPDVIVAWGTGTNVATLEQLRRSGIPTYSHHVARLSDIPGAMRRIGALAGTPASAAVAADVLASRIDALRTAHKSDAPGTVLIQVWDHPVYTVGGTQLLSDAIGYCGYRNAYADLKDAAPAVTVESVLARNPNVIIAVAPDAKQANEWLGRWRQWGTLRAVREQQLVVLTDQRFSRLGPSAVEASEQLCDRLRSQ